MQVINNFGTADMKTPSRNMDDKVTENTVPMKRPRTSEDFLLFCKFILDYENYEAIRREEKLRNRSQSPRNCSESSMDDPKPERTRNKSRNRTSTGTRKQRKTEQIRKKEFLQRDSASSSTESDDEVDGFNEVTCYCGKPYAGRPMIECSRCLTWLHLSCARVKRTNIPDEYICTRCRETDSEFEGTSTSGQSSAISRTGRNKSGGES
ncbi:PHD finger protein 23B-like isoform X2 [Artemia franciscana]|uniref:Zinc finger PHD-type domain-containing protein n=1 Tax=Artemia franciscana TaxID=6661 RepID=A0AA88H818_ARTSF|nr:hypothetical protein QYM36_017409 [Artemia franciscana]